jgi:hypothetical protein
MDVVVRSSIMDVGLRGQRKKTELEGGLEGDIVSERQFAETHP